MRRGRPQLEDVRSRSAAERINFPPIVSVSDILLNSSARQKESRAFVANFQGVSFPKGNQVAELP